jgi:hypothetical protein
MGCCFLTLDMYFALKKQFVNIKSVAIDMDKWLDSRFKSKFCLNVLLVHFNLAHFVTDQYIIDSKLNDRLK